MDTTERFHTPSQGIRIHFGFGVPPTDRVGLIHRADHKCRGAGGTLGRTIWEKVDPQEETAERGQISFPY